MNQMIAQLTFGDTIIPASQALPPAGHDAIAFRPACTQVVPVGQANGSTAWTLPMPDGRVATLLELPHNLDATTAYKELDSYGLCKIGGDTVPILYSRQLPERSMASPIVEASQWSTQPSADIQPTSEPQGGGMVGMIAGSVFLLAIAAGVVAYSNRKPKAFGNAPAPETKTKAKAKQPDRASSRRSALDDLMGGGS